MCKVLPGLVASLSLTSQQYSGFGTALALKEDLLAIGAPGHYSGTHQSGAVFLLNMTSLKVMQVRHGEKAGGQFGQSVALVDIDGDGKLDLAVSAPGEPTKHGYGAVHLFFDIRDASAAKSDLRLYSDLPGVFGNRLHDLEGSLLIGSPWLSETTATPQSGWLHGVTLKRPSRPAQAKIEEFASWNLTIPEPSNVHGYDWFGWSAVQLRPWWFHGALVIGAPGVQVGGKSYGACFIWETDRKGHPLAGKWQRVLGEALNGQYGGELGRQDESTVLVASTTETWGVPLAGCIRTLSLLQSLPLLCGREGDCLGSAIGKQGTFGAKGCVYRSWQCFKPSKPMSSFGQVLVENDEHLVIAAPASGVVQVYYQ